MLFLCVLKPLKIQQRIHPSVKKMILLSFCKRSWICLFSDFVTDLSEFYTVELPKSPTSPNSRLPRRADTEFELSWNYSSLLWEALCYKAPELRAWSPLSGKVVCKKKTRVLHVNKEDAELRTTELSVSTDKVHIAIVSNSKRINNGKSCPLHFLYNKWKFSQPVLQINSGKKNAARGRSILNLWIYHNLPSPLRKKRKKNMPLGFCN